MTQNPANEKVDDDEYEEVPWSEAALIERLEQLGQLVVARGIEERIFKVFDRVRRARLLYREPRNVVVWGETGVGKSDILARYLAANPETRLPNGNVKRPVLLVEIRDSSTPASVAKQMLGALGVDDEFHKVSTTDLSRMLKKQMVGQQVELAMLDEFNNTINDNGNHRSNLIANWVKDLSKTKKRTAENPHGTVDEIIPFAMVGTSRVKEVLDADLNPELYSITPYRIEIDRYRYRSVEEKKEFVDFLNALDDMLPFDHNSDLGTRFADKLHLATFGLLRQVGFIVTFAAELALTEGAERIHEHHLYTSIEEQKAVLQSNLMSKDGTKAERERVVVNPFEPPLLQQEKQRAGRTGRMVKKN